MQINAFRAWRPPPERVEEVASVPYDVVTREEAIRLAEGKPASFLHVIRPDIDLPTNASAEQQITQAVQQYERLKSDGHLEQDNEPAIYAYQQRMGRHVQTGIVACCHAADYETSLIRRHEHTRPDKEEDRVRHMDALSAHTGPVFLTYRDVPLISECVEQVLEWVPLIDLTTPDGVQHTVWRMESPQELIDAFATVSHCYIADGHHRAASAVRVARMRHDDNPAHNGQEEYNWFLSVLFPAGDLQVLAYNRVVHDLNGLDPQSFLNAVRERCKITPSPVAAPAQAGRVNMYLAGAWYALGLLPGSAADALAELDVSRLQDSVLNPVLGIDDPRSSTRIEFVGGIRGVDELSARVDAGDAAVAFSMFPVTVDQLMAVSDSGAVMPPKSTWFEPKLRSGLFVHEF